MPTTKFRTAILILALMFPPGVLAAEDTEVATLYKTPDCGCCEGYATYLRNHGIKVKTQPVHNMPLTKKLAGVPNKLEGCHTTKLGRYVIEGHVPIGAIRKLLRERPDIRGISLPGMPQGSPGMSGTKTAPFTTFEFRGDGKPAVFAVE